MPFLVIVSNPWVEYLHLGLVLVIVTSLILMFIKLRKVARGYQGSIIKALTIGDYLAALCALIFIYALVTSQITTFFDKRSDCEKITNYGYSHGYGINWCDLESQYTEQLKNEAK